MRVLANDVHVNLERIPAGTAESDLPEGVRIGNPNAWIDTDDLAHEEAPEPEPLGDTPGDSDFSGPPQSGPGSSKANWVIYASNQGVEVPEDATRESIIEFLVSEGIPVE